MSGQALRETRHVPVLRDEVVEYLRAGCGGRFLDCTLGGAGHTLAILEQSERSTVVAFDRDRHAIERAEARLAPFSSRVTLFHSPFSQVKARCGQERFDGILADLGVSTDQLFEGRGFSFHDDTPLDMRMDPAGPLSADTIVNGWAEGELAALLRGADLGSQARLLARAIVRARPIAGTRALAAVVTQAMAGRNRKPKLHPATLVFQAIRIAVNSELEELSQLLEDLPALAAPHARVAVICFHSLEDKLVARRMRDWETPHQWSASWAGRNPPSRPSRGRLLTKKALKPGTDEVSGNPSARSARMRVFEFN